MKPLPRVYVEQRSMPPKPPTTLAADVARHMQSRQYLGTTLVICESPHSMLSAVRKQWLKAARQLQTMRASTLNAEEILRLTHAIMHMQNILFVAKSPIDNPNATVYFLPPAETTLVPYNCHSVYATCAIPPKIFKEVRPKLPESTLIIAYEGSLPPTKTLQPKIELEHNLRLDWDHMIAFFQRCGINPHNLVVGGSLQFGAIDDALDTLLGHSNDFLQRAANFQRVMSLAQPLTIFQADEQRLFEIVVRLAHRVQSLSPGTFNSYLLKTFGERHANSLFLHDIAAELAEGSRAKGTSVSDYIMH